MKINLESPIPVGDIRKLDDIDLLNICHYPKIVSPKLLADIIREPRYHLRLEKLLRELPGNRHGDDPLQFLESRGFAILRDKAKRAGSRTASGQASKALGNAPEVGQGFLKNRGNPIKKSNPDFASEATDRRTGKGLIGRLFP